MSAVCTDMKESRGPDMKTKVERLEEAGILKQQHFNDDDKKHIETMSDDEVDVLIKLRKKMGEAPSGKEHMRPNFPV